MHHEDKELDQEYLKSLNSKHENTPRTHQHIRTKIMEAIRQLRLDIVFSNELREKFLQERVDQETKKNNIREASAIRSIKNCERTKRIFMKIKSALDKNHGTYMTSLMTPRGEKSVDKMWEMLKERREEPREWDETFDTTSIDSLISEWCNKHFQQASETPLTSDQWKNILENPIRQEEILDGTFQPPTSDPTTKEWFKEM